MATSVQSSRRSKTRLIIAAIIAVLIAAGIATWAAIASASSAGGDTPEIPESVLPDATQMGAIELNVNDLELMTSFYSDGVGLEVLSESEESVELGLGVPLITLTAGSGGAETSSPTEAGLYHSAILYETEQDLARVVMNLATLAPQLYQGASDHAVSIAFYFADPEGNGLELYVDRPSGEWVWENGEVKMGSAFVDPNEFVNEHIGESPDLPTAATMGHVHMKVGDLAEAEKFYADTLGFAVTARSDGALFYSAGGYHHHLATNVWQSQGAGERTNATGLGSFVVSLGSQGEIDAVATRLEAAGVPFESSESRITVLDPWGNAVRITQ